MADGKTMREALQEWSSSDSKVTVTLFLLGPREITGKVRAVAGDTVIIGAEAKPYYIAIQHIVWVQEQ